MSDSAAKAVFLSYASQDVEAAKRLCASLRAGGVEVWFDQSELVGGDAWDAKIRRQIAECALFVPMISAATQARLEGYFRIEWKLAAQRTHAMAEAKPFLLPIVIDATHDAAAHVPGEFRAVQWTRLSGGEPTPQFVERVKQLLAPVEVSRAFTPVLSSPAVQAARAAADDRSIAVLPFANMSSDAENEYFCDGIAEEITSALSKVGRLQVAGRTSAFSFKGKTGDLREIGRTLNVGTVLEGSVRKAGNRLRITAQLIKVADGYHLWSERFDRQFEDIFDIQDEIALAVVEALKVTLLGREKESVLKRSTENPEAYRLCLQARSVWQRWTDEGFRSAIALFNEAIAMDSNNPLAHNGLADCYLAWNILGRKPLDLPTICTLFETAIRLNPDAGLPYAVFGGIVNGVSQWDWPLAEEKCRRAAELAPREGHVWSCYGILRGLLGRHEEAVAMHRRAVELDPVSPAWNAFLVFGLLPTRDWEGVRRETERTLAILPEYWLALMFGGQALGAAGRWAEAVATFERAVRSSGEVPYAIGFLGHALARAGRPDEARQQLAQLRARAESHYVPASALAFVQAGLGERDETFALLARALDVRDHWAVFSLTHFPLLDDLRPDPRFQALVRRLGL